MVANVFSAHCTNAHNIWKPRCVCRSPNKRQLTSKAFLIESMQAPEEFFGFLFA